MSLTQHYHGKNRVRLLKTKKDGPVHSVFELTVNITLWGDYERVYTAGDNTGLVATDTMKNTVYVVAKTTQFDSLESYGLLLTDHFIKKYPMLSAIKVDLTEQPWTRYQLDGQPHAHGFTRQRRDVHVASVHRKRYVPGAVVESGIQGLDVLKTTQSGFEGFLRDENTSLPETDDRLMSTCIAATWHYSSLDASTDFNAVFERVRATLLATFFGPPATGTYSKSVQSSLFEMGNAVLRAVGSVSDINLDMPNVHFLPVRTLANHGLQWTGEIHLPTDEPHGTINATVSRQSARL